MDLSRLAKVLALTSSTSDGEALAACRRANAMLRDARQTWADVLRPHVTGPARSQELVTPDGRRLAPPVGVTWGETALWLVRQDHPWSRIERRRLEQMARELAPRDAGVSLFEAEFLTRLYRTAAGLL